MMLQKPSPSARPRASRRSQLGSELLQELFRSTAGPKATAQTPGAFWKGMRLFAIDGTLEAVPDTPNNREAFRSSLDDELSHSPFPQARLLLLIECGTHLICDAEISSCRQGETTGLALVLERWRLEDSLLLWDSGFPSSAALFEVRARGGHVLGRLKSKVLEKPFCPLVDGSYLTSIYEDQDHQRGKSRLLRVIPYTFTDPRIPGAGEQVYRQVDHPVGSFLVPSRRVGGVVSRALARLWWSSTRRAPICGSRHAPCAV